MNTFCDILVIIRKYNLKIVEYKNKIKILNVDSLHPTEILRIHDQFKKHKKDIQLFLRQQKQKVATIIKRYDLGIDQIDLQSYKVTRRWITANIQELAEKGWTRPQLFRYPNGLAWRSACWGPYMLGRAVRLEINDKGEIVFHWLIGSPLLSEKIIQQNISPLSCVDYPSHLL